LNKLITVAPVFDEVTKITFQEKERVKLYAEEYGIDVFDYSEGLATRCLVEEILREYPTAMFFHADHGNTDKLYGVNASVIVDLKNVGLLATRECYMDNCSSAKTLGVEAFKHGCPMFWGYTDVFSFTTDALDEFSEFVLFGIKRRIEDWNNPEFDWQQTLDDAKFRAQQLMDELIADGKIVAASCMANDARILVCLQPDVPPQSDCPFRRFAVWLFGEKWGWRL